MRDIKFRAWDGNKMTHEFSIYSDGSITSRIAPLPTKPIPDLILMQYTGLKDKNGKEIYEGDILKNTRYKNQLVEVYWKGCTTDKKSPNGLHWINWGGWDFRKFTNDEAMLYAIYDNEIEVVSNIYQSPHLLTKKE